MLDKLKEALIAGEKSAVESFIDQALASGIPTRRILNEGLIAGMEKVGELFKNNEIFIPEVLVSARAMNAALTKLEPHLLKDNVEPRGLVVIGTVKGDLHDIGKNLVAMMLKGAGYKIVDLGADVGPEKFVEAAGQYQAHIIALSALLTTTMIQMKNVIQALKDAGLKIPVIVGGAPLTQDYADQIGAGGYAPDAASAVDVVHRLVR
jgi:5-methyltetrahydrofolate--homocysteine methyltransferase